MSSCIADVLAMLSALVPKIQICDETLNSEAVNNTSNDLRESAFETISIGR